MRVDIFRLVVKRMDEWCTTNNPDAGRELEMLQKDTNFPVTITKEQSTTWNELFHGKWKKTMSKSIQKERRPYGF